MPTAGSRFGSYEIVASIGAGGMGEVYRARDTKLGRDVAIKIVSDRFGHDAERMARFQREAHLLASLNHLHIAAIHGLEEANGAQFLVLELVEGETLAEASSGPGERIVTAPIDISALRHEREARVGHHMLAHLRTEAYKVYGTHFYPPDTEGARSLAGHFYEDNVRLIGVAKRAWVDFHRRSPETLAGLTARDR